MRKHLLSNWINISGTIVGVYCILLFIAIQQLLESKRGFTIETVFIETIGGSLIYTFGILVQRQIPIVLYIVFLFGFDYFVLRLLKGNQNLSKRMNIETAVICTFFIVYAIRADALSLLVLPLVFTITQQTRRKWLKNIPE